MSTPRKILILSLTRMGDIIQSIPFFRRLRFKHPDAEIHVLVEAAFAGVAELVPGIDHIHRVSLTDLLPPLAAGRAGDFARATAFYSGLVRDLQAEGFAEVWNLTHTRPFTMLNYLLAAEQGRGVTLDRQGLQLVNSPWLRYFFATNLARPWCQFNLVDVYANCIDGVPWQTGRCLDIPRAAWADSSSLLLPPTGDRTLIAVHPGASQASKTWPIEEFRRVAERFSHHTGVEIVLIGGKPDAAVSAAFAGLRRIHDFQGKTSPAELAALLAQCRLLISNDSGPMHIAAGVGTRVIDITLGSALASETAPYGDGHLVVEPDSACFPCSPRHNCTTSDCTARISADAVAGLAEWELGWSDAPPQRDLTSCRIYRTGFSRTDGLLDLDRLFHTGSDERDDLNRLLRSAWLAVLEKWTRPAVGSVNAPRALSTSAARARLLARQASGFASQLAAASPALPQTLTTVQNLAALLGDCEQSLEQHLNRHGLLRSLQAYSTITRASLTGDDLAQQAAETAQLYRDLQTLLTPLSDAAGSPCEINQTWNIIEDNHENLAERS